MKTAIIIDVDNITLDDLDVIRSLRHDGAHFYAVGLAPSKFNYKKCVQQLDSNRPKFHQLIRIFAATPSDLTLIANMVASPESSDVAIAKLVGSKIVGHYDRAVLVSNDNSIMMVGIMLKQIMPTWVMVTKHIKNHLQDTNRKMHGVPVIRAKHWGISNLLERYV